MLIPIRSYGTKSIKNALSLEEFLFRSRVRSTYRELARQIYKTHERQDLMSFYVMNSKLIQIKLIYSIENIYYRKH